MNSLQTKQQELNLPLPIPDCIDIAYRSMKGELIGLDDIAVYANISIAEAIKVITNPLFNQMIHHLSIANAKLSFDAIAFKELLYIAKHSLDEKNKISAIKSLGDMLGRNESKQSNKQGPVVNINLDSTVRNIETSPFKGF